MVATLAVIVAILVLFFDNGVLVKVWNASNQRYRWDSKPLTDRSTRKVVARISHGYDEPRHLSQANVVVPQSLALRILWRPFHKAGLDRWAIAASLLPTNQDDRTLTPRKAIELAGILEPEIPLPTWKFWTIKKPQDPQDKHLLLILRFDRKRRTTVKRVGQAPGNLEPPEQSAPEVGPAETA